MKIGVIGTGYVGLVSGVMLTTFEHEIISIDSNLNKVQKLQNGECIIYEEGLESYLQSALQRKLIKFSNDYLELNESEAVFICVGTPANEDGSANLNFVKEAIEACASNTNPACLIIIKSTVPPGSAKFFQEMLIKKGFKHKIVSNPEFLREGSAVYDFNNPDRIVIGTNDEAECTLLKKIYVKTEDKKLIISDTTTAELIKYTSNSFLAIKLSFINEMANLCEKIEADVEKLSEGVGLDKRIGSLFLKSGPGYGGSCFPKDTLALSMLAKDCSTPSNVLDAAIKSNLSRYAHMKDKIKDIVNENRNISILGVAFKANTDDVRESPAVEIVKLLLEDGFNISVYDPAALENLKKLNLNGIEYHTSIESCCKDTNAIVILTEWDEFAKINWSELSQQVKNKVLIDLRKIAKEQEAKLAGFEYFTIGRAGERS